ncbi:MAG: hypothetical protein ACKV22_07505 [Bryobacteraceae bacterium]
MVLQLLQAAGQPVSLKTLLQARELGQVSPRQLREAVERLVAEGRVYPWSGKRFSHEKEDAAARRMVLGAVADQRVAVKEVLRRGKKAGWKPAALQSAIDECLAESRLYAAGKGSARILSARPFPALEEVILRLAGVQPWTKKELAVRSCADLPWQKPSDTGRVIQNLLATGKLRENRQAKMLFAPPADPDEFIRRAAEQSYRNAQQVWRSALGGVGAPDDLPARILDTILRVEPQKGMLVTMRQLRQSEWLRDVAKEEFDRAVLDLARAQRIALSQHSAPFHLAEAEREYLIRDDRGVYYGGVSWRG